MKKALSIILSFALTLTMVGCVIESPATVMQVDGTDVAAGVYLYYQFDAASAAASKVEDATKDMYKQEIEGQATEAWIHAQTQKSIKSYIYIDKLFNEKGLKLTEDENASIETQVKNIWEQSEKLLTANGIGQESLRTVVTQSAKKARVYADVFVKDNKNDVSDAAAKEYMDKTYSHVTSLTLPTSDSAYKGLADDKVAEIKKIGEEVGASVKGGTKLDEALAKETLTKVFAITGHTMSDDMVAALYTTEYLRDSSTTFPKEVLDILLAAKSGDTGSTEIEKMPFIWAKIPNFADDTEFATYKVAIVNEIQDASFTKSIEEGTAAYTLTEDASAVRTYSPKKIKQVK